MKRILLALALMASPVMAQQSVKVIQLKYADPQAIRNLLGNFGVETRVDSQMKVITLSGSNANVTTAEEAIKQLDVPGAAQKDIDLTVYFVVGSDVNQTGTAVPSDLQGTIATLKSTFPFKNYTMLDVLSLRTRSGVSAHTSGQLTGSRFTDFTLGSANLEGDGSMIQLNNVHAGLRVPSGGTDKNGELAYRDTGITTQVVDVKEGQKLVLGRSSLNGPDTALFLILIAKVAQ